MTTPILRMRNLTKSIALTFLFLAGAGCAHQSLVSVQDSSNVVGEILDQVNLAILEAKAAQGSEDGPEISSVEVDLQLGASTGANASFPLGLVFPTAQATQDELHRVSLNFAPKASNTAASGARPDHALVLAIEEIYRSVARANPNYQFQRGTMQLQCTLQAGIGASYGSSSGSGSRSSGSSGTSNSTMDPSRKPAATANQSVTLVPIQIGATTTRQSIQTIILTFSPHGSNTPTSNATPAPNASKVP